MIELNVEIEESSQGISSKGTGYGVNYIGLGLDNTTDGLWKNYDCEDNRILTEEKAKELCEKIVTIIDEFMKENSEQIIKG